MADTDSQIRRDDVCADTIDHHPAGGENAQASEDEVRHLAGLELPDTFLPTTTIPGGQSLRRLAATAGRLVVYTYPAIGAPDRALITADWMTIPGAFGCTAESCSFRDLNSAIHELGAAVCGLSTQPATEQREAAQRLSLTFPLLSDAKNDVIDHLQLPTWSAGGHRLLKRFTLIARGTVIQHVFAPVTDPATHASDVAAWLRQHPL